MQQRYLKEHRPALYSSLILSEKLYPHLLGVDRAARERMDAMLPRIMEAAGVTEELKSRDPMRWVGLMNTLKAQVEEIIINELIIVATGIACQPVTLQTFICNFTAQLHILALFEQKNYNVFHGGMNMDYMTLKEASEKWGVTPRRVNYYCAADRIPGAVKMATIWLIPKDAVKPADRRRKNRGDSRGKDCDM